MTAAKLIAAGDPRAVERIERDRQLRPTPHLLLLPVSAAVVLIGAPWAWQAAAEHRHRTALILGVLAGAALIVASITVRLRARYRTASQVRRRPSDSACGRVLPVAGVLLGPLAYLAAWWALQQDGRGAALAVAAVMPFVLLEVADPLLALLRPGAIAVRRWRTRGRDARARLAAHEQTEVAWTLANAGFQNGSAERDWIEREHPEAATQITLVPRKRGRDRGLRGLEGALPPDLAPGLRRDLGGATLAVQPVIGEQRCLVTTPSGEELEVNGLGRAVTRPLHWTGHAQTVVSARVAVGPTALVVASVLGGKSSARARALLVGGGEQSVPRGVPDDARVRLGDLALRVPGSEAGASPRVEVFIPEAAEVDESRWTEQHRALAGEVGRLVPGLDVTLGTETGILALRMTVAGSRTVHATPLGAGWVPYELHDRVASVLIQCPELGVVEIVGAFGAPTDHTESAAAIAALLRR